MTRVPKARLRITTSSSEKNSGKTGWLLGGAVFSGLIAAACCTVPLLLIVAGVGGAWLSAFSVLEPLRPLFILSPTLINLVP